MNNKLKNLDFFGAQRIVAGTKRGVKCKDYEYYCYFETSHLGNACLTGDMGEGKTHIWWPTVEQQKEKAWEVEPEKPEEIFVWGACDEGGGSYLYSEEPHIEILETGTPEFNTPEGDCFKFTDRGNLFPKDKPTKCRLVEGGKAFIPWRPFIAEDMPEKRGSYLIVLESGEISTELWENYSGNWGFCYDSDIIKYCFPLDEIPTTGDKNG